ncbi:hypothetical protein D3C80_1573920 [compost metagenome]
MRTQSKRLFVFRVELRNQFCPKKPSCAHFSNFHEVIHPDGPKEAQTGRKGVHIHSGVDSCSQVFQTICQGVSQLDAGSCSGFLHVITRNGNRVESWHFFGRVGKNVCNDLHRRSRGVDIRIPNHEFLQNIILNGSGKFFLFHSLFFCRNNVESHNRNNRSVHCH